MSEGLDFDDSASRTLEAAYLTDDVEAQRGAVLAALSPTPGERVLDIGCGPGLLGSALGKAVGPEGRVDGIDVSEAMLALARRRCADQPHVHLGLADACTLPFDDASFDVAVSTQVYEYVADIPRALGELRRVLRRGGRAVILDTDYDSFVLHTETPELTSRILEAWDDHFVHAGLPRQLSRHLRESGLAVEGASAIPMFNPEYGPHCFSYHLTQIMGSFAVGRCGITRQEADSWVAGLAELGERGDYFFSLNRYLFEVTSPD